MTLSFSTVDKCLVNESATGAQISCHMELGAGSCKNEMNPDGSGSKTVVCQASGEGGA